METTPIFAMVLGLGYTTMKILILVYKYYCTTFTYWVYHGYDSWFQVILRIYVYV